MSATPTAAPDLMQICPRDRLCKWVKYNENRMWANAQRDGRPAEYRWRPLLNAAVWLTPTARVYRAVTLPI